MLTGLNSSRLQMHCHCTQSNDTMSQSVESSVGTREKQGKQCLKTFEGKIAVITGGTEGIGVATAKALRQKSASCLHHGPAKELDEA